MKNRLSLFLVSVATILAVGCGGGGGNTGGTPPEASSDAETSQQQNSSGFQYPSWFPKSENEVVLSVPEYDIFDINSLSLFIEAYGPFWSQSYQLNLDSRFQKSHCDKGFASGNGTAIDMDHADDPKYGTATGNFTFDVSSGYNVELVANPDEECLAGNDFFDGNIIYDIDVTKKANGDKDTVISATLNNFYVNTSSGGKFNGARFYNGRFQATRSYTDTTSHSEFHSDYMKSYLVDASTQEAYAKSDFIKFDYGVYKNIHIFFDSFGEGDSDVQLKQNYEVEFKENNIDFKMIVKKTNESTLDGHIPFYLELELQVPSDRSKDLKYTFDGEMVTFTKNGEMKTHEAFK